MTTDEAAGRAAPQERAVLWVRSTQEAALAWAAQGVTPVAVAEHPGGWVTVASTGDAHAPGVYREAVPMLLARMPRSRLRPSIGIGVRGERALVVLHTPGWRPQTRWAVVDPVRGHLDVPDLPGLSATDLARIAEMDDAESVADALAGLTPEGSPVNPGEAGAQAGVIGGIRLAEGLARALGLPGAELLGAPGQALAEGATTLEPDDRQVARFAGVVDERLRLRAELDGSEADDGEPSPAGSGVDPVAQADDDVDLDARGGADGTTGAPRGGPAA